MYRVFVKPGCAICKGVVLTLENKGIPFEKVDVSTTEGWEQAKTFNITSAGTILNENNELVQLQSII